MEEINTTQPETKAPVQSPIQTPVEPEKKKSLKPKWVVLGLIIFILILISAGTAYFFLNSNKQIACTQETQLCPDGSSVGRTGPKCEFAECPNPLPTSTSSAEATNWKAESFGTWLVKYPALGYECNVNQGFTICVTANDSFDFSFTPRIYSEFDDPRTCGKNYQECLNNFRREFSQLEYERERIINNVSGIEFLGKAESDRMRLFVIETKDKQGIATIYQNRISPELDILYNKILSTFKFTE